MLSKDHYVPILKWKRGERSALENVSSDLKNNMTPLIEIQPVPFDHPSGDFSKSLDEHLSNIGEQVQTSWNQSSPVFVDLNTLYNNEDFTDDSLSTGNHFVEFVVSEIESKGIPAIPVTGIFRYVEFHQAVKDVNNSYQHGVCIRLVESDLVDISVLRVNIDNLINFLEIEKESVDIILDYKQILSQTEQSHLNNLILTIAQLPYLQEWRSLILASTAYPSNLRQIPTNSNGTLPRTEWTVYQSLRNTGLARIPSFSDYNISHPDFVNLDPRIINMAAGIKYTTANEYLIFRGIGVKNNGFGQMVHLCQQVLNHPSYYGRTFSAGDEYIYNCANSVNSPGNAERWVNVGVNHHLTLVAYDLANQHAVSTVDSR
ncbi:beta family protein [Jeotgalibacillus soli]|uniref:Beta protein n=1 Tax=Jeotgalibacillus soli TaxID=889306 RepID=A0A0C2VP12_9BACL|nr:beta family protein [Jeotgalibacillus soli]KIL45743.1 hypothetical protein KP78_20920 [Jeotgalibacillus soli]